MTKSIWHSSRYSLSSPLTSHFNFPPLESAILPEGLCEAKAHTSASARIAEPQKQRIQDAIWFISLTQTALLITPLSDIFYNLFLKIPTNRHFTASSILGLINPLMSSNSNLPSLFVKQKLFPDRLCQKECACIAVYFVLSWTSMTDAGDLRCQTDTHHVCKRLKDCGVVM